MTPLETITELAEADFVFSLVEDMKSKGVVNIQVNRNRTAVYIDGKVPSINYEGPLLKLEYGELYLAGGIEQSVILPTKED
jgi:hypothetical protein